MIRFLILAALLAMPGLARAACASGGGNLNLPIPILGDTTGWAACMRSSLIQVSTASVVSGTSMNTKLGQIAVSTITGNAGGPGIVISSYALVTASMTVAGGGGLGVTYGLSAGSVSVPGTTITSSGITVGYGLSASTAVITYIQASSITATGDAIALGNIGIGRLAPATKLHMSSGTLTVDGTGAAIVNKNATRITFRTGIGGQLNTMYAWAPAFAAEFSLYDTEANAFTQGATGRAIYASGSGIGLATGGDYGFSSTTDGAGAQDINISRISAGVLGVGTGAAGSVAGTISAAGLLVGAGTTVVKIQKLTTASTDLGGAITATCTAETNFAMTGVAVGDACNVQVPAALAATDFVVCRSLVDNVALKYCTQGAAVDPAAMVFHITTIEY